MTIAATVNIEQRFERNAMTQALGFVGISCLALLLLDAFDYMRGGAEDPAFGEPKTEKHDGPFGGSHSVNAAGAGKSQ